MIYTSHLQSDLGFLCVLYGRNEDRLNEDLNEDRLSPSWGTEDTCVLVIIL